MLWARLPKIEDNARKKAEIYTTIHNQLKYDDGSLVECGTVEELAMWFSDTFNFDFYEVVYILHELKES